MGRGLAWLLLAVTGSTGTTGGSSTGDGTVGSSSDTTTSSESSSTDTTSSSTPDGSTTSGTGGSTTSDPGLEPTGCLSAPADVGPCLSVKPDSAACDCRQGSPSPTALLLALLVLGARRRSRHEVIDALAASGRLPPDVVARVRVRERR